MRARVPAVGALDARLLSNLMRFSYSVGPPCLRICKSVRSRGSARACRSRWALGRASLPRAQLNEQRGDRWRRLLRRPWDETCTARGRGFCEEGIQSGALYNQNRTTDEGHNAALEYNAKAGGRRRREGYVGSKDVGRTRERAAGGGEGVDGRVEDFLGKAHGQDGRGARGVEGPTGDRCRRTAEADESGSTRAP